MLQSLESELMQLNNIEGNFLKLECCSVAQSCLTLQCSRPQHTKLSLSFTISRVSDAIHTSCPLSSLLAFNLSRHEGLFNESALGIRCPKYWCFSFSVSPSNEYSGLISFRIDSFDHLTVSGTLKSLLQHYSSKASILWCSAFFIDQLSHTYMTTRKTTALTTQTFVSKVMSLIFNTLSRLVITFFPRRKPLLIS